MKRFFAIVAVLLSLSGMAVWSDDDYVLEQARKRARSSARDSAEPSREAPADLPYAPVQFSFVPGLSVPFGLYDSSVALGVVGSMSGAVYGVQASSVFNISLGRVSGAQTAGVFNISEAASAIQAAGVFNISRGASFIQSAGVFNIAGDVSGVQYAGVFNIADSLSGVQGAGVFNIVGTFDGVLAAGLFNVAGSGTGAMVGLVNIADRLDGVAIGLVNVIGNGVHDTSIDWQWETETVYAGYRTGTPFLYASFYAGMPSDDVGNTGERITFGAGLGHRQTARPFSLDFELCAEAPFDPWAPDWDHPPAAFGSLRATLGLGGEGGTGIYLGVKADFEDRGGDRVPAHLRSGEARRIDAFGVTLDYWPKLFAGIRF